MYLHHVRAVQTQIESPQKHFAATNKVDKMGRLKSHALCSEHCVLAGCVINALLTCVSFSIASSPR
ncbi:hypothetical protein NECAME_14508 [Necator americanus]|uniref:Uncharacterized protein n=1 Tax=Necator americanus TaxID=51031 RepID=W2SMD3_NECAM|nr:hypothetical protein NECAME_14508 [Necator americanus]ETN70829.1 hypothetical protein NECAME_14508 [Necator americanus]